MSDMLTLNQQPSKWFLDGEMTFASVEKVHLPLLKDFSDGLKHDDAKDILLSLAKVRHFDSAGLSLLVEMLKLAKKQVKNLVLVDKPKQLIALMTFYGVLDIFPKAVQ